MNAELLVSALKAYVRQTDKCCLTLTRDSNRNASLDDAHDAIAKAEKPE